MRPLLSSTRQVRSYGDSDRSAVWQGMLSLAAAA